MDLINSTFLTANIGIGQMPGLERRMGVLTAKGTFHMGLGAPCRPDIDNPIPIFPGDHETPLGLLPRDDLPKGENLDVIVLGCAYPPEGKPAPRTDVSLQLGPVKRTLAVFGDRFWQNGAISSPIPFERMPLTYTNAFGGKSEVEIDEGSFVTVADPRNQEGKGFNAASMAASIAEQFKVPQGFPKLDLNRPLPNIEDPDRLISSPEDAPDPMYWAAVPLCTAIHAFRSMGLAAENLEDPDILAKNPNLGPNPLLFHRAHPSLDLDLELTPGMQVTLNGLCPEGVLQFTLPNWKVGADLLLNGSWVEVALRPDTLVFMPEEKRFSIIYRFNFTFDYRSGTERTVRLTCREGT